MAREFANETPDSKLRFIVMLDDAKTPRPVGELRIVTPPRHRLGSNAVLLMRWPGAALGRGVREPISGFRWRVTAGLPFIFHG